MNKNFKVVFSKARNALMVVNEATASVQHKGAKTVIAAAVAALMSASVMADTSDQNAQETPSAEAPASGSEATLPESPWKNVTINQDGTVAAGSTVVVNSATMTGGTLTVSGVLDKDSENSKGDFALQGGTVAVKDNGSVQIRDFAMTGGKITAAGTELQDEVHGRTSPAFGAYNTFVMDAGEIELSKGGRIWIGTSHKNNPASYERMELNGGKVTLKDGGYITGNKRWITTGTYYEGTDNEVAVTQDTLAGNTIGFDGAEISVQGKGNVIDAAFAEVTAGVFNVAKDAELTLRATTSTSQANDSTLKTALQQQSSFGVLGGDMTVSGKMTVDVHALEVTGGKLTVADGGWIGWDTSADASIEKALLTVDGGTVELQGVGGMDMYGVNITDGHVIVGNAEGGKEGAGPGNSVRTSPSLGGYDSFTMTGGTVDLGNNGRIWIGSAADESRGYKTMNLIGGTINMNGSKDYNAFITGTVLSSENNQTQNNGNTVDFAGTTVNVNGYGRIDAAVTQVAGSTINIGQGGHLTLTSTYSTADTKHGEKNESGSFVMKSGHDLDSTINNAGFFKSEVASTLSDGFFNTSDLHFEKLGSDEKSAYTEKDGLAVFTEAVVLNGADLSVSGDLSFGPMGGMTEGQKILTIEEDGALMTKGANIFKQDEDGKWNLNQDLVKNTSFNGGFIEVTDTFSSSLESLQAAQNMLGGKTKLVFVSGTLTDEEVSFADLQGLEGMNNVVSAPVSSTDGSVALTIDQSTGSETIIGVKNLQVDADTKTIVVSQSASADETGALLFRGTGENLIAGVDKVDSFATGGDLILGYDSRDRGVFNADVVKAANLEVDGAYAMNNVEVTQFAIDGSLTANDLTINSMKDGDRTVSGTLTVNNLLRADGATTADTAVEVDGTLVVNEAVATNITLNAGSTMVIGERTNARAATSLPQIVGEVTTSADATDVVFTTNANGEALLKTAATQHGVTFDPDKNVGLYVDNTIGVDSTSGKLIIGKLDSPESKPIGSVSIGKNAIAVVNLDKFSEEKAVFSADEVHVNNDATIIVQSTGLTSVLLNDSGTVQGNPHFVDTNAWLLNQIETKAVSGVDRQFLTVAFDDKASDDDELNEHVKSKYAAPKNADTMAVINAVGNTLAGNEFVTDGRVNDRGVEAMYEYFAMPAAAGTYNAAYDAAEQVWGAVQRHTLAEKGLKSVGLWADVFYSSNEAKTIYGDAGYESDIYGGVLGVDYTADCGGKLGLAFTIGTADSDSKGMTGGKYSNDADFWGLSLYASKNVGESLDFSADVTYLSLDNDIDGHIAGASLAESIDSSVISIGVRADWTAWSNNVAEIVPHVGIRYANIDVDNYRDLKTDSLDVVEMPVGIAVNGKFEGAGWKFTPSFDFTVVPQIGDKDVAVDFGDKVDVLDNVYNTTLGVSAEYGDWTFGLNYRYGFGSDDRSNNSVNINAAWRF